MASYITYAAEILGIININTATLLVSIAALFIAWRSRELAQQAFSLSLFNNRYKLYYEFRNLIVELSLLSGSGFPTKEHVNKSEVLFWESRYIFGNEIEQLLQDIFQQITIMNKHHDSNVENELKLCGMACKKMKNLLAELNGKSPGLTLDSYFNTYLYNNKFKIKI